MINMNMKWLCIIAGVLLLLGIPTGWPYAYYTLLRWAICILAAIVAYRFYDSKSTSWTVVFAAIAVLFNPIAPVYLNKSVWVTIDLISTVLFFIGSGLAKQKS
jgi:hypothetical protein